MPQSPFNGTDIGYADTVNSAAVGQVALSGVDCGNGVRAGTKCFVAGIDAVAPLSYWTLTISAAVVNHTTVEAALNFPSMRWIIDPAPGAGGVTSVNGAVGALTVVPTDPGITVTTTGTQVGVGQLIGAEWTVGLTRVYAVDFALGNDASAGFADPATNSAADYAIACAAAGAVAKKTLAGLAAIFPREGQGRTVEVVIAANAAAYVGSLDTFMAGAVGYSAIDIRATGTNTTAGATRFDGSVADATYLGAATATGMNAAGYNPTGAPTNAVIQCLQVGGAAPAFPAEPALPLGARIRFDSATTTVALRNVSRFIAKVSGTDTITITETVLPAVPVAADIFYIELPGVTFASPFLLGDDDIIGLGVKQLAGLAFTTGTSRPNDGRNQFAFCLINAIIANQARQLAWRQTYTHPVLGILSVGGTRVTTTATFVGCRYNMTAFGCVGALLNASQEFDNGFAITSGCWFGAGTTFETTTYGGALIGLSSVTPVGTGPRILAGAGGVGILLTLLSSSSVGPIAVTGCTGPAVKITSNGAVVDFQSGAAGGSVSGSTGNLDVGLDLSQARNCYIYINTTVVPTVTGANGDIRLAGGQIITWAQALNGIVDLSGNHIVSGPNAAATVATRGPNRKIGFSGSIIGAAGATVAYLADTGPVAVNQVVPLRRPVSSVLMRALRVTNLANTSANAVTVTLFRNGVATAMTISIPAATAANTKFADLAHPIYFADGDDYDIRMDDAGDVGGVVTVSGTLGYC